MVMFTCEAEVNAAVSAAKDALHLDNISKIYAYPIVNCVRCDASYAVGLGYLSESVFRTSVNQKSGSAGSV